MNRTMFKLIFVIFLASVGIASAYPIEDTAADLDTKVIGGYPAKQGTAPFIVSLQVQDTQYRKFCGGTILRDKWVITAAHCIPLYKQHGEGMYVRAGVVNAYDDTNPTGQFIKVENVYVHPNYTGDTNPDDLALLELKAPFKFNANVQPMALPPAGFISTGDAWLFGWGDTLNLTHPKATEPTQELLNVRVPIVPVAECQKFLRGVTDKHICAGTYMKTQCGGDSGGPLLQRINQQWALVGVVSFSMRPCGIYAGAFVRTSAYIDDFILPAMEHTFTADHIGDDEADKPPVWN